MEAWPQLLILLLHGGMAATSDSSSPWRHGRNLTKTSQNFQSYTLPNFLRKLLKTSNPALFQSSRNLTKTSYKNFQFLHFWLRNLANFSKLFTKTSQNFQSYTLPILHFWLRKPETSSSSNLKT